MSDLIKKLSDKFIKRRSVETIKYMIDDTYLENTLPDLTAIQFLVEKELEKAKRILSKYERKQ